MMNGDPTHNSPLTIHQILSHHWGHPSFRPLQEDIINSILHKKDTLALLPTGGGKSICYQVPGLLLPGLCLVISPLIALMKDQVEQLRKRNITAYAIYSGMSRKEVENTFKVAAESNCKFLYVSPERLETRLFKEWLNSFDISLIAVDEAHCISQWGYDFRPPYLRIAALREYLPGVPVLALTASATPVVQQDITEKLRFNDPAIFRQSFARPNLSYSVFAIDSKINKITEILEKVNGSGLVYCKTRRRTKEISELLRMHNISSDFYHAGLSHEERNRKQEEWITNKTRVMACTNAFGMGIDKPDVRVVIHADVPECLENYYQEAGRAGRDGKKSYAVLLFNEKETEELKAQPSVKFPELKTIREVYQSIVNYLQLPAGSGEGNYYEFDYLDFLNKFKLDTTTAWATLKTLEQEDVLTYSEQIFLPSTVEFTCNKDMLYQFEIDHEKLEPVIKTLLRTYEGIFERPVRIHEKSLSFFLKTEISEIIAQLEQLHSFHIIRYEKQKDNPQIFFPANRVMAEELTIDQESYQRRKLEYKNRIEKIIEYIHDQKCCRSVFIANYFGDSNVEHCGVCDNCLAAARKEISKEEFEKISNRIVSVLTTKPVSIGELIKQLPGISTSKAWQVIEFLQSENKISVTKDNLIRLGV